MWGYISTEASYQSNFNVGFSTTRSDVLVHLAQWQYWWWFWFALVWSFYYLIVIRVIRYRTLKMRPKIVTSYRPHGKWGDFLACIIPMIWCLNILANSNFILRLIEWQNESSLFTVRVRARQWYWIYKFELKSFTDILTAPKNVGHNKWQINVFGDLQTSDDYLHILQLRSQNKWVKNYWGTIIKKSAKSKKNHIISIQDQFKLNLKNEYLNILNTNLEFKKDLQLNTASISPIINIDGNFSSKNKIFNYNNFGSLYFSFLDYSKKFNESISLSNIYGLGNDLCLCRRKYKNFRLNLKNELYSFKYKQYLNFSSNMYKSLFWFYGNKNINLDNRLFSESIESTRWAKRSQGVISPVRLIKYPVSLLTELNWKEEDTIELLRFRFNNEESKIQHKVMPHTIYLTLKQKKYKRKKIIPSRTVFTRDDSGKKIKNLRSSGKPVLRNNSIIVDTVYDPTVQYRMLRKNKMRSDLIPVTLARRLLRTKKTLVLPAHVNITLITNSYDIVHSWFVPGLGIKLDCVPGRSTHHTFFIDNVGFYYGQCAEICGRYHHHMPIRICALPFEHFLVWWHTFGLPKLISTTNQKRYEQYFTFRKFSW